jgi:hypothetical protein
MPTLTFDPIASYTASGSQSVITFSSIPGTYKHLFLSCKVKGTASNEDMLMRFNGSSSNTAYNFSQANENANGTVSIGHYNIGDTAGVRISDYVQTTAQNSDWAGVDAYIMDYASTSHNKTYQAHSMNAVLANQRFAGWFDSTSAITQIGITLGGTGNFVSGSKFTLYGLVG